MDTQSPDNEIPQTADNHSLGPFQSSGMRLILVSATLLGAMILTALLAGGGGISAFWMFPVGLFFALGITFNSSTMEMIGGWLLYLGIALAAVLVKRRLSFVLIYIVFIVLLLLNISGCLSLIHGIPPI